MPLLQNADESGILYQELRVSRGIRFKVFQGVTPCGTVEGYQRFGRCYSLYLQGMSTPLSTRQHGVRSQKTEDTSIQLSCTVTRPYHVHSLGVCGAVPSLPHVGCKDASVNNMAADGKKIVRNHRQLECRIEQSRLLLGGGRYVRETDRHMVTS